LLNYLYVFRGAVHYESYNEKIDDYYNNMPYSGAKSWLERKNDPLSFLKKMRFDTELNLVEGLNGKISLKSANSSPTYKVFKTMKKNLLKWGYLHFDDAYFLANRYFKKFPRIINLIQKRFSYVFVDEMQDMDKHQYDLLEETFFQNGDSFSNYQRIGDTNQAIFSGIVKLDEIWKARDTVLKLKGSYRLTQEVANIVKPFGLESIDIEGRFQNPTGSDIKPIVLVFNDESITNVIPEFAESIRQLIGEGKLPDDPLNTYKAIAWVKNKPEVEMIGLTDYWNNFDDNDHRPKEDYSCMESYLLHYDKDKKTLESIRKNILSALLRILRYEDILIDGRNYTKRKLLSFLKEENEAQYERLKLLLYQWSINVIRERKNEVYSELKEYASEFLDIFGKPIDKSRDFIETAESGGHVIPATVSRRVNNDNVFENDGIKIELTTIHAVKGQTHTATLYLETFYQKKYESDRLIEQFKGNNFSGTGTHDKQSTKMAYVGLSRPSHLLCLAVHENRFQSDVFEDKWQIVDITS
jgi:ATP-dependent DNA helicase UvrD/PcrA